MIPLFISYVNRYDLLTKAVCSAQCKSIEVNVLDNSDGPSLAFEGVDIVYRRPTVPLTFAQTQQWMWKIASGDADYGPFYLWAHSDAECGEGTVEKMVELVNSLEKEGRKWATVFSNYDSFAALKVSAVEAVGGWDPILPQYFADNSMYRKFRLAGYEIIESGLPVKHEPSQTIKSDPYLNFINGITFPFYEHVYRLMWGGTPGSEQFDRPFNR